MNAKPQEQNQPIEEPMEILDSSTALESLNRSEIDIQIATAHKFKRVISTFKREAKEMATIDEETAASCFYALKRGDNVIQGPSVRLAEIIGSAWGNLRYGSRIISIDEKFVVAQGACHDLERNNSATIEVRRRITDRNGRRYNDDMIGVTAMAASSIALRNAIFKVVPFSYAKEVYQECIKVAVGGAQTLASKRQSMVEYFGKMHVTEKMILETLGKKSLQDVDLDDLALLKGFVTAIKDGDTTIEAIFKPFQDVKPTLDEGFKVLLSRLAEFKYQPDAEKLREYMKILKKTLNYKDEVETHVAVINGMKGQADFDNFKVGFERWLSTPMDKPAAKKKEKPVAQKKEENGKLNIEQQLKQIKQHIVSHLSNLPTMDAINEKLKLAATEKGFFTFETMGNSEDLDWLMATLAHIEGR